MNTHKILVAVSQKKAIEAGFDFFGEVILDVEVSKLTAKQRKTYGSLCMKHVTGSGYIKSPSKVRIRNSENSHSEPNLGEELFSVSSNPDSDEEKQKMVAGLLDLTEIEIKKWKVKRRKDTIEKEKNTLKNLESRVLYFETSAGVSYKGIDRTTGEYTASDPLEMIKFNREKLSASQVKRLKAVGARWKKIAMDETNKKINEIFEEKEKDQRKKDQIQKWAADHGTDNQKKRFDRGLLSEKEILDEIRDQAFLPYFKYEKFDMLSDDAVCCDCEYEECEYEECEVDYNSGDIGELTANQFDFIEEIEAVSKDVICVARYHIAEREDCENVEKVNTVHISKTVGEFVFTREFVIKN